MATYVKFQSFVEKLAEKIHNLGSDDLTVGLTTDLNAPSNTDDVLVDITEVVYTNCSSRLLVVSSSVEAAGIYKLVINDLILEASGGTVGPFQWVFIYNDTATNKDLICYFDYGSEITLQDGESLTLDFDPTNGLLQLT